jgi:hypothetical protein
MDRFPNLSNLSAWTSYFLYHSRYDSSFTVSWVVNVRWLLQITKYEGHFRVDFFLTLQRDFKLIPSRSREAGVTKSENQFSLILVEYNRFIAIRGPWKKHESVMCCPSCTSWFLPKTKQQLVDFSFIQTKNPHEGQRIISTSRFIFTFRFGIQWLWINKRLSSNNGK